MRCLNLLGSALLSERRALSLWWALTLWEQQAPKLWQFTCHWGRAVDMEESFLCSSIRTDKQATATPQAFSHLLQAKLSSAIVAVDGSECLQTCGLNITASSMIFLSGVDWPVAPPKLCIHISGPVCSLMSWRRHCWTFTEGGSAKRMWDACGPEPHAHAETIAKVS